MEVPEFGGTIITAGKDIQRIAGERWGKCYRAHAFFMPGEGADFTARPVPELGDIVFASGEDVLPIGRTGNGGDRIGVTGRNDQTRGLGGRIPYASCQEQRKNRFHGYQFLERHHPEFCAAVLRSAFCGFVRRDGF